MLRQQANVGILEEDRYRLPVFVMVRRHGRDLMHQVFSWAFNDKGCDEHLKEFLIRKGKIGSNREYKDNFKSTERKQVNEDKSGKEWDISLSYKIIKKYSADLSTVDDDWNNLDDTKLENLLKRLKDHRNDFAHELPYVNENIANDKIEDLAKLFKKVLEKAGEVFHIDTVELNSKVDDLREKVELLLLEPLTKDEVLRHHKEMSLAYRVEVMRKDGAQEVKKKFEKYKFMKFISFIFGFDVELEFDKVYTKLEIETAHQLLSGTSVDHKDIIKLLRQEDGNDESAIGDDDGNGDLDEKNDTVHRAAVGVVQGVAGAGKSTLMQLLLRQWTKAEDEVAGLGDFDLIIPLYCRDTRDDSLPKLFQSVMRQTCHVINEKDGDILTCAEQLRTLFLVDGFDECNQRSKTVLKEIFDHCEASNNTVLCTTRPEKVVELDSQLSGYNMKKTHFKIKGVPMERIADFVNCYHNLLIRKGVSTQSTEKLVKFIIKSLQLKEFFQIPVNLVMVTYLWSRCPEEVQGVTTVTELYIKVYELLMQRHLDRLQNIEATRDERSELQRKTNMFVLELWRQAMYSLAQQRIILPQSATDSLKAVCTDLGLPFDIVASSFLDYNVISTPTGPETQLTFPHKDAQEFLAARWLLHTFKDLAREDPDISFRQIIDDIHRVTGTTLNYTLYKNTIKHLGGLMNKEGGNLVTENTPRELVDMIEKCGTQTTDEWLDIIGEVKLHDVTVQYIACTYFSKMRVLLIRSTQVAAYSSLIRYMNVSIVTVDIAAEVDPSDLPHLKPLLQVMSDKHCRVHLFLRHHYQHHINSDDFLACLCHSQARCQIEKFQGCLSGQTVPYQHLRLFQCALLPAAPPPILQVPQNPEMKIRLHVPKGWANSSLVQLPDTERPQDLEFSNVGDDDVQWVVETAKSLTAPQGLQHLALLESNLSRAGCSNLVEGLAREGVVVHRDLIIDTDAIDDQDRRLLTRMCRTRLNCAAKWSTNVEALALLKAVCTVGRDVLLHILRWGTPEKRPTETLEDYLLHHRGISPAQYRKTFDRTMREKISSDPSCETFDVSTCISAIRLACHLDMAGVKNIINEQKLEFFVQQIKNERNHLVHELRELSMTEMQARWEMFRATLLGTLFAAFDRYNIEDDRRGELVQETEVKYDNLMEANYYGLHLVSGTDNQLISTMRLFDEVGCNLMSWIFRLSSPDKDPNQSLEEYLVQRGWSRAQLRKTFSRHDIDMIASNPSCEVFDFNLLYRAVQVTCEHLRNFGGNLYDYLHRVNDIRSEILRSFPFYAVLEQKQQELQGLFTEIIGLTCELYNIDDIIRERKLEEMMRSVEDILDDP